MRKSTLSTLSTLTTLALALTLACTVSASFERLRFQDAGDHINVFSDQLRFVVQKQPFSLQIFENTTDTLLYAAQRSPLQLGKWAGVSYQQHIYEGYSFRVGKIYERTNVTQVRVVQQPRQSVVEFTIATANDSNAYVVFEICDVAERRATLNVRALHAQNNNDANTSDYNRVLWAFDTDDDEGLYGFGERFVPEQNRKNQRFYTWVEDGGFGFGYDIRLPKGRQSTYMPMPFTLSTKGYGFLLNTTYRSDWNITAQSAAFITETNKTSINLYFGGYPADSLVYYIVEVGKSLIPPPFQFGMWEQFATELPNASVTEWPYDRGVSAWREFIELDIPASVAKIDLHFFPKGSQRGSEQYWRDVNTAYEQLGIISTAYFNPMIAQSYEDLYYEAAEKDLFVRKENGEVARFLYKGAGPKPFYVSMLDYSNPKTVTFWQQQVQEAVDMGFRGWMQDYGEYVDPYQRFYNGWTGEEMHNEYVNLYHDASYQYFKNLSDPARFAQGYAPEYMYFVRSGYSGTQGNVWAVWTGDPCCDFTSFCGLPAQLSAMLSAGLSGIPYIGSDTGGFVWVQPPSHNLWLRWLQLSVISPIMEIQNGGTSIIGKPRTHLCEWGEGVTSLRYASKFRMQIFPYLYTLAHSNRDNCLPLMRHHLLSFPRDAEAVAQNYQFMLGDQFLAAPAVQSENQTTQNVYLPKSHDWYDLTNSVAYDVSDGRFMLTWSAYYANGGYYVEVPAGVVNTLPVLFVRAGAIVALQDPSVDTFWNSTNKTVVSQADRAFVQHYWVVPQNASGQAFGRTYDGARCDTVYDGSAFVWNATDAKNRLYTVQVLLARGGRPSPSAQFSVVDGSGRSVQAARAWSEIVDVSELEWKTNEWRYLYNATTGIVWLRYTGCAGEGACTSSARITQA